METEARSNKRIWLVYLGGFLLAVHYALVAYVNSSLLKQFVSDSFLNILYAIGSVFSIIFLFLAPLLLRKYGSIFTLLFFTTMEALAVFGMGSFDAAILVIVLFVAQLAAEPMLYFCLDVNLEQETKTEGSTGSKRGIFLSVQNIAWILSPLAFTFLLAKADFSKVYFLSAAALIPLFLIVSIFYKNIKETNRAASNILAILRSFQNSGDKARIIGTQFILNFFYSWMMIYLPLLLSKEMGFSWEKIGVMFTIMLLPFLLFEFPAGLFADKKIGEKELLITGFVIMSLATFIIPMLYTLSFLIWASVLFVTRIGASLVEISSETFFFKHIKEEDTGLISLFRMSRPLSLIIASLITIPIISYFSYSSSFYFLAFFTLCGLFFIPKVDTK